VALPFLIFTTGFGTEKKTKTNERNIQQTDGQK
jgi:hypothetical protein